MSSSLPFSTPPDATRGYSTTDRDADRMEIFESKKTLILVWGIPDRV